MRILGIRNLILLLFLTVLAACEDTAQKADVEAITQLINEKTADTKICLKDKVFRFPDVIVGSKYSGEGLAQLDVLASAGLLSETEEIISKPYNGPKYIYHYKQHQEIERKIFYLTELGIKYYRTDQGSGYFCYARPENIEIETIDSHRNDQGDLVLSASFSYDVKVNPAASWISSTWIQREFPQASWGEKRQITEQQFIKDSQGLITAVFPGTLDSPYW